MKIDTETHLTIEQAMAAIGCTRRSLYRAIDRAKADGIETTVSIYSRRLVLRNRLDALKARYFPFGSQRRHEMHVIFGGIGGKKKAKNARRRAKEAAEAAKKS